MLSFVWCLWCTRPSHVGCWQGGDAEISDQPSQAARHYYVPRSMCNNPLLGLTNMSGCSETLPRPSAWDGQYAMMLLLR
jgi:hypothetical protein